MEFVAAFEKRMNELERQGRLADLDLKSKVNEKVYDLAERNELNEEVAGWFESLEDVETDHEYWCLYHAIAEVIL